ncbi:endospore germination permease [Paenibacillus sp. PL91]|uniref:GerAB/ArcD/ProY family transporter n=1 Tax=Paenibacillus sp. PL91 TaxID=2729538 RepID=UPI00145FCC17|nr:endospore germination permease [Paenibacillus sp. PL91]MBC9203157.1 endospore germination permease [Paenibacillus sp. PL91]
MKVKPFGILASIMMIVLSVGLVNHVLIVPMLFSAAERDAWICVLIGLVIVLPWALIPLFGILKRLNGMPLDKWLMERLPRFLSWFLMGVFLLMQLALAFETLIMTASWTATTYLPNTPSFVVCFVFLGLCLFASISGLRTIAYVSCILLPIVVLLGDFVMSANMPHKDYHYLLPMLENGPTPLIKGVLYTLTSSSELFVFMLIQHHISGKFKRWPLFWLVLFLSLLTLGPVLGSIAEFGPAEAEKMRYPAFSQWRLVSIGKYFEHVDFFAIYQWMSGALIRLALCIHVLSEFGPLRQLKRKWISPAMISVIIFVVSYIGINHMLEFRVILEMFFRYTGIIIMALTSVIWIVTLFPRKQGNKNRSAIIGSEEAEQL